MSREIPGKKKTKKPWELNSNDEICQIDKDDFTMQEVKLGSSLMPEDFKVIAFFFLARILYEHLRTLGTNFLCINLLQLEF